MANNPEDNVNDPVNKFELAHVMWERTSYDSYLGALMSLLWFDNPENNPPHFDTHAEVCLILADYPEDVKVPSEGMVLVSDCEGRDFVYRDGRLVAKVLMGARGGWSATARMAKSGQQFVAKGENNGPTWTGWRPL